jgi:S1-C subfamily serine protease
MDALDFILIAIALVAAVHGWRVGAVIQLFSFIGFLSGLALGSYVIAAVDNHVSGGTDKTIIAVLILFLSSLLLSAIGKRIGIYLSAIIDKSSVVSTVDSVLGSTVAVIGTLVVCWLVASILVQTSISVLTDQISGSQIMNEVESVMPPVPNQFAALDRYLVRNGFPQVLVNVLPQPTGPLVLPSSKVTHHLVGKYADSTFKIIARGCPGVVIEGSGFAVKDGLIITNAHVVAGTKTIFVKPFGASPILARPILFDPRFDLAILLPLSHISAKPLAIDPDVVERGQPAVVLGHPGGGPLTYGPAAVESRFVAQGRDIYDNAIVDRVVYELEAVVKQGDSGGPLIGPNGKVLGVVFSRSTTNNTIGYALASPKVLAKVNLAAKELAADPTLSADTQNCID